MTNEDILDSIGSIEDSYIDADEDADDEQTLAVIREYLCNDGPYSIN